MELVSVIVPVYNTEKYLERCISSITEQIYQNLEIILVDDGSTDNSLEICNEWSKKDKRIKVVHKENGGLSSARNAGIDASLGDYLVLVDSDDRIAKEMISKMYSAIRIHDADLAICDFIKGTEDFYPFAEEETNELVSEEIDPLTALRSIYKDSYNAQMYVAAWGKLYKKELFNTVRYPEGKLFEDIYVTHRILYDCKRIAVVSNKLVYYYQHSESIMNSKFNVKKLDYLQALNERILFFQEKQLNELERMAYDDYLHSLIWEYSRVRDILHDRNMQNDIKNRFREVYTKGYSSKRYPQETAIFLYAFYIDPELIVLYWKISSKIKRNRGLRS